MGAIWRVKRVDKDRFLRVLFRISVVASPALAAPIWRKASGFEGENGWLISSLEETQSPSSLGRIGRGRGSTLIEKRDDAPFSLLLGKSIKRSRPVEAKGKLPEQFTRSRNSCFAYLGRNRGQNSVFLLLGHCWLIPLNDRGGWRSKCMRKDL